MRRSLLLALLLSLAASSVGAYETSTPQESYEFREVVLPIPVIVDSFEVSRATPPPKPPVPSPPIGEFSTSTSQIVHGKATWYCLPGRSACHRSYRGGMYAAAGPALRVGNWRGRTVTVCSEACVTVKLIDWCACGGGRVIDLYADAFRALAPLSRGVLKVTVSWE